MIWKNEWIEFRLSEFEWVTNEFRMIIEWILSELLNEYRRDSDYLLLNEYKILNTFWIDFKGIFNDKF